jgi:hypothetical protein
LFALNVFTIIVIASISQIIHHAESFLGGCLASPMVFRLLSLPNYFKGHIVDRKIFFCRV